MAILALGKARSRREPNLGCRGADRPGWCDALPKISQHESCRMGRHIVVMKLVCSPFHCECDGHTVYKLSQLHLTADWLAPRESDCSQMHSKISSDWLPSYITSTWLVLEIFKIAGYFLVSPCIHHSTWPHITPNYRLKEMTVAELKKHKVTEGMANVTEWSLLVYVLHQHTWEGQERKAQTGNKTCMNTFVVKPAGRKK